ncbi:hypothetical protein PybrP1_007950 [[Pythium] brassicae (nom. inval.)]|nr:hypothetical protein PybrP1_007950 [[Pythium] brassicae (nom. inval.)]
MGSGSSLLSSASVSSYRFGHDMRDEDSSERSSEHGRPSKQRNAPLEWIGTTLEMPPKPFSLDNYFQTHAVVGTGMLGKVRLVQHRKSAKFYALKSLKKKDVLARKMVAQLEAERGAQLALTKLNHPFMARYFGSFQTSYCVHLLMEYVPGGELFRRLHELVNGHTPFFRGKDDSPFELYTRIVKGQVAWPNRMDSSLKDLLRKMLVPDAAKRLSDAELIKQHLWFGKVDWLEVAQRDLRSPHTPALHVEGDHSNFDSYPNSAEETKSPMSTYTKEFRNF